MQLKLLIIYIKQFIQFIIMNRISSPMLKIILVNNNILIMQLMLLSPPQYYLWEKHKYDHKLFNFILQHPLQKFTVIIFSISLNIVLYVEISKTSRHRLWKILISLHHL